jgi:hypothetical protein
MRDDTHINRCIHIVTLAVSRKQIGKHVSAEKQFLDTHHRWVLNKRSLGYENEGVGVETRVLLQN